MKCWFSREEALKMSAQAAAKGKHETGGILIGYWSSGDVVVRLATAAGPKALHTPSTYDPDSEHDAKLFRDMYEASAGTHTYLGDWHSHPQGLCKLSATDKRAMTIVAQAGSTMVPLMAIISGGEKSWRLKVWRRRNASVAPSTYPSMKLELY